MSESSVPSLQIDDDAVVWSVPRSEISERLSDEPLVIVMHGRGSHENDLPSLFPLLPSGVVYASLRAPISGASYGLGGWTWFPLDVPDGPAPADVSAAAHAVLHWVDRVEAEFGAPAALAALGFSQGGMMSIQLLREAPYRFAAAVDLSGVAAGGSVPGDEVLAARRPPLFWGRDVDDPIIAASGVAHTQTWAPSHFSVTAREYAGIAHSISPSELDDVAAFLREVLPLDVADQVPSELGD
ncbi:MAG: esterase [Herbiconiux sp.]|uniref:alpha/beta hydrolase n=1 Tax=Herbiconiux sp. TaxID=1871186 RepID=UPI001210B3B5|nr:esterase [Herbiconiux sp.]TAJ47824.1 MAG: esterase [Herbiconiux sp.]